LASICRGRLTRLARLARKMQIFCDIYGRAKAEGELSQIFLAAIGSATEGGCAKCPFGEFETNTIFNLKSDIGTGNLTQSFGQL